MTLLRTYFRFESVVYLGSIVLSVALLCPYLIHPRAFVRHFLRNSRSFPFISQIHIFKFSNFLEIREPRVKYDLDVGSFFKACLVPPGVPPGLSSCRFWKNKFERDRSSSGGLQPVNPLVLSICRRGSSTLNLI
jgi:hypothetical protein